MLQVITVSPLILQHKKSFWWDFFQIPGNGSCSSTEVSETGFWLVRKGRNMPVTCQVIHEHNMTSWTTSWAAGTMPNKPNGISQCKAGVAPSAHWDRTLILTRLNQDTVRNKELPQIAARAYEEAKQEKKAETGYAGVPRKLSKMGKDTAEWQPWATEAAGWQAGLLHCAKTTELS